MTEYRLMIAAALLGATACATGADDWPGGAAQYNAPDETPATAGEPEPAAQDYALRSQPAQRGEEELEDDTLKSDDFFLTPEADKARGVISAADIKRRFGTTTRGYKKSVEFGEALITFDFGSADILASSEPQIYEIGYFFQDPETDGRTYKLVGHTDSVGDEAYNLRLSTQRAEAVKRLIEEQFPDIYPAAILVEGAGENELKDPTDGKSRINRRVELIDVTDLQ